MYNSASEIIAIHKKNGGDIANFGAPSDYDHLYVITQGDLTLAYAARGGKCLVEIPKKEFNKRQKHADIEYINVSLDSDAALLPPYCWRARDSDAFRALFKLPELCQKNATLLMLFVLCIAAPLLSILYPLFGGSIAAVLTGLQTAPQVLQELLWACGGPDEYEDKHWVASVPHIWQPHCELGALQPSDDLVDYAVLEITIHKKSMTLPAPVVNRLVALENGIPQSVVNAVNKNYPFSIPVVLGRKVSGSERMTFTLDGSELQVYDPAVLQEFTEYSSSIPCVLRDFAKYCNRDVERFVNNITKLVSHFVPREQNGRYICETVDAETRIKAILLAVLQVFILWSIEQDYCTRQDADVFFRTVWGAILPETSPKPPEDTTAKLNPENAYTFLLFFKKYLHDHIAGIRKEGETWDSQSVAWLRTLKNQTTLLLICGRRSLLTAYKDWLQERDVELDISAEAALQAALAEDGIPFRTGGRDTTWKYKLSPADKPLPCMGVALNDLLSLFKQHEISIGNDLGSLFSLESDDCKAEADFVAEIDESEENEV